MNIIKLTGEDNKVGEYLMAIDTVITSGGIATFYATHDGTDTGNQLFEEIIHVTATPVRDTTNPIEYPFASEKEINADGITITINVGVGVNLAGDGNTITNTPDNTPIRVKVIGTPFTE